MIFEFRIYDYHEKLTLEDGNVTFKPFDEIFNTFHLSIDYNEISITSFRSFILFDSNDYPVECTKVFLSDASFVFAVNKYDTFKKNLNEFIEQINTTNEDKSS